MTFYKNYIIIIIESEKRKYILINGGIVELVNTSASQAEESGFEPPCRHQFQVLVKKLAVGRKAAEKSLEFMLSSAGGITQIKPLVMVEIMNHRRIRGLVLSPVQIIRQGVGQVLLRQIKSY